MKLGIVTPIAVLAMTLACAALAQTGAITFQTLPVPPNLKVSDRRSNAVIRSARDWSVWVNNLPEVPGTLPTVDFEHYTLLVANAGYLINGPYDVRFDSVTDTGNTVRVHVSVTGPAGCTAESPAGNYVAMAVIERTDKPVEFDVSTALSTCRHR